jgi:ComF family protein
MGAWSSVAGLLLSKASWKRLWEDGLNLIFPPRCAGCGRVDTEWCLRCGDALDAVPLALSTRVVDGITIAATGAHRDRLQRAVQALKYENLTLLRGPLGKRLSAAFQATNWSVDAVVPVPLHPNRLVARGYNQAQLLAEEVAHTFFLPCLPMAIQRVKDTPSQVMLNQTQRQQNMIDAFSADSRDIVDKTILIIDDVCTTGATLNACAQVALGAGARAVYGLTVTTPSETVAVTEHFL